MIKVLSLEVIDLAADHLAIAQHNGVALELGRVVARRQRRDFARRRIARRERDHRDVVGRETALPAVDDQLVLIRVVVAEASGDALAVLHHKGDVGEAARAVRHCPTPPAGLRRVSRRIMDRASIPGQSATIVPLLPGPVEAPFGPRSASFGGQSAGQRSRLLTPSRRRHPIELDVGKVHDELQPAEHGWMHAVVGQPDDDVGHVIAAQDLEGLGRRRPPPTRRTRSRRAGGLPRRRPSSGRPSPSTIRRFATIVVSDGASGRSCRITVVSGSDCRSCSAISSSLRVRLARGCRVWSVHRRCR